MRIQITLQNERLIRLPIDHYHLLRGAIFDRLERSDPDYARFVHDEGYIAEAGKPHRFKLFTYSALRVPKSNRRFAQGQLEIAPGYVTWVLSSPKEDFLRHEVIGLLAKNDAVTIGGQPFRLIALDGLPDPAFSEHMAFTCLTPFVAAVKSETHTTPRYLRPADGAALSEAVRVNAVRKYRALHGKEPGRNDLTLTLSQAYLDRDAHGGTKKITLSGSGGSIDVIGTLAPLTLKGSPELIQIAYECGLGEKNSSGLGMLEVDARA